MIAAIERPNGHRGAAGTNGSARAAALVSTTTPPGRRATDSGFVKALLASVGTPAPASEVPPEAQRASLNRGLAVVGWPGCEAAQATLSLSSGAQVHVYLPERAVRPPIVVYLHGGSFVAGGVEAHGATCRALAEASRCAVALVAYRLAPEHRAPAALDDAVAAVAQVRHQADALGIDGSRIALFGDSAGGALAIQTAFRLRDAGQSVGLLAVPARRTSIGANSA